MSNDARWKAVNSPVAGLKVRDILPSHRKIVTCGPDTTVEEAMRLLTDARVLSLPVVEAAGGDGKPKVRGVVDVMDLALVLVGHLTADGKAVTDAAATASFFKKTVGDVLKVSRAWALELNPTLDLNAAVDVDSPFGDLLNLMWGGWHRVPVLANYSSDVLTYVSQSDVLRFFVHNMRLVLGPDASGKSLEALGFNFGRRRVVALPQTATAFDVLTRLLQEKVSAAPIVDADGRLVASFSVSDLRLLTPASLADLALPVLDFLGKHAYKNHEFYFPKGVAGLNSYVTPQTCAPTDALELVVYKTAALRVHRLWVVGHSGKPIGLVTLTDLMKSFLFGAP